MNEINKFERRLEDRLRTFAVSGIRPVDSAALARAVVGGRAGRSSIPSSLRWLRLPDRRVWSIVAAGSIVVLAVALFPRLQGFLMVGSSEAPTSPVDSSPSPPSSPPATGLGLVYALDGDIYVADSDGANPVRIVEGEPGNQCGDSYADGLMTSPDGRHVAYRSWWFEDGCPGTVYISDLSGSLVASFPGVGWDIAWSPDSTRLATWLEAGADSVIGIYGIDGTLEAELDGSRMCCGDYDPIWSPDGAAAVLVKEAGFGSTVWELPIDGGAPVRVPVDDPRASLGRAPNWSALTYSPDGTRAVMIDSNSLVIVDADGTNRRVLGDVGSGLDFTTAAWSPIGDLIAYVETRPLPSTMTALRANEQVFSGSLTRTQERSAGRPSLLRGGPASSRSHSRRTATCCSSVSPTKTAPPPRCGWCTRTAQALG